ncbi:hypothetical protein ABLN67_12770, partial [Mycobacterium tuberculosis]
FVQFIWSWVFNRFIYRREWVFAFIVKRFRVFSCAASRAPCAHRSRSPVSSRQCTMASSCSSTVGC